MNDKFTEDIKKYIINFKNTNFGDLESLNKYNFENYSDWIYFIFFAKI